MIRYFKKEIPENPLFLATRRSVPFKPTKAGVGILATNDPGLLVEIEKLLPRQSGGLVEIAEPEYLDLRDYKPSPPQVKRAHAADFDTRTPIDHLYVRWKIAKGRTVFKPVPTGLTTVGKFIHVLERHRQPNPDDERRVLNAFWSWSYHYECGMVPCHVWEYPRSAKAMGDTRDLPYLKDVLAEGLTLAMADDDVLILTNDDTVIHQKILHPMTVMLRSVDALSSFRMNFEAENMPATDTPVEKIRQWGEACLGRDLFAFRAEWLRLNWHAIPDFCLGEAPWDLVLATMVRMAAGVSATKMNHVVQDPKCELDRGYVIHQNHARNWMNLKFSKAPAKVWNNQLSCEWNCDNGFEELMGRLV